MENGRYNVVTTRIRLAPSDEVVTHKYNPDYSYLDESETLPWSWAVVSKRDIEPTDSNDDGWTVELMVVTDSVREPAAFTDVMVTALRRGCSCEHDCCGCAFGGYSRHERIGGSLFKVTAGYSPMRSLVSGIDVLKRTPIEAIISTYKCKVIRRQGGLKAPKSEDDQSIVYVISFPQFQEKDFKVSVNDVSRIVSHVDRAIYVKHLIVGKPPMLSRWSLITEDYFVLDIMRAVLEYEKVSPELALAHVHPMMQAMGKYFLIGRKLERLLSVVS